jgi:hypothetical protein
MPKHESDSSKCAEDAQHTINPQRTANQSQHLKGVYSFAGANQIHSFMDLSKNVSGPSRPAKLLQHLLERLLAIVSGRTGRLSKGNSIF